MFEELVSKIKSSWEFLANGDNVKTLFTKLYTVVQKLMNVVNVLQGIVTDPKFVAYVPTVLSALGTVLTVFNKLAPLLGVVLSAGAPASTPEEAKAELDHALADLNKVLEK